MRRTVRKSAARGKVRRSSQKRHNVPIEATIVVAIEKGIADVARLSGGSCRVIVRDYDTDGTDDESLSTDAEGRPCLEQVFRFRGTV